VPNQPDINKRLLAVRVSREFYRRLQNAAKKRNVDFGDFLRWLIERETKDILLTKEDYEIIEQEKQSDLAKRKKFSLKRQSEKRHLS